MKRLHNRLLLFWKRRVVREHRWLLVGIVLMTWLAFLPALNGGFVWDDLSFISTWEAIQPPGTDWGALFRGNLPDGQLGVYRPLRSVAYALAVHVFGQNATAYHVLGVLTHVLATVVVYGLSWELLKDKRMAGLAALIFGIHPIHVEAVAWITASFDTIGNLLLFASLYLYARFLRVRERWAYVVAVIMAGAAFFTNELTLILPLLLVLIEWWRYHARSQPFNWQRVLVRTGPVWLINAFYWMLRFGWFQIGARADYLAGEIISVVYLVPVLLVNYLRLLIVPFPLMIDHRLTQVISGLHHLNRQGLPPISLNWASPVFWGAGTILVIASVLMWQRRKQYPLLWFFWLWMGIGLLPVMQFVPQTVLFSERYAYIASFGVSLILGWGVVVLWRQQKAWRRGIVVLGIFGLFLLALQTFYYSSVFASEIKLWWYQIRRAPWSVTSYKNLTPALEKDGLTQEAIYVLEAAVRQNPNDADVHFNLGVVLYRYPRDLEGAVEHLSRAIELKPYRADYRTQLAAVLLQLNEIDAAIAQLERVLGLVPQSLDARMNLGMIYAFTRDFETAEGYYRQALEIAPEWAEIYTNMGLLHKEQGDDDKAVEWFERALELDPNSVVAQEQLEELRE